MLDKHPFLRPPDLYQLRLNHLILASHRLKRMMCDDDQLNQMVKYVQNDEHHVQNEDIHRHYDQ